MTTTEAAPRKPTAMEIARETADAMSQLRTELTELRDQVREGGMAGDPVAMSPKLETLDKEFSDFVAFVNEQLGKLSAAPQAQLDGEPVMVKVSEALAELKNSTAQHFTSFSKIVDGHNTAATKAIEELRSQVSSLEEQRAAELEDPAFVEGDVNDIHQRINELRADLNRTHEVAMLGGAFKPSADTNGAAVPAIYRQVHELMKHVTDLGKDKKADQKMGGYAFRSIDSAMDAVGRALRTVGVMFQPREIVDRRIERYETVSKDGYRQNWTHVWVTQRYAFVSLVDGSEMAAIEMDGEARDNGDKSTSKADSMRFKYALLQALCIPINGLPESDGRDGTEGGDFGTPVGRGSAGDAFDNASTERPGQQPTPQAQTPDETRATPYGYGHQPAESPGGQAHAQAQAATPRDDRTPEELATAAYHALVALAGLEKPAQRPQLTRILNGIQSQDLGGVTIQTADGRQCTLGEYAGMVNSQVGA